VPGCGKILRPQGIGDDQRKSLETLGLALVESPLDHVHALARVARKREEGRNGGIFTDMQKYIHEMEYWLTYEAWRVIVCSDFMKAQVERSFQVPGDKIDIIYNGVDAPKFEFEWSEEDRLANKLALPKEIAMYGPIRPKESANSASTILVGQTLPVIVGGGNRERFEKFVRWYGLQDKVLFTGFMANRSLHQLPVRRRRGLPLYELFGIVALEGMAGRRRHVRRGRAPESAFTMTGTNFGRRRQSLAWQC
jgi:glycosyltransferase involved in cell wall biosynthesis